MVVTGEDMHHAVVQVFAEKPRLADTRRSGCDGRRAPVALGDQWILRGEKQPIFRSPTFLADADDIRRFPRIARREDNLVEHILAKSDLRWTPLFRGEGIAQLVCRSPF